MVLRERDGRGGGILIRAGGGCQHDRGAAGI